MTHEILNLFAVPVYKAPMGRSFTEAELASVRAELEGAVPAVANYASRNKQVLKSPALASLRSIIQGHLDTYFREVFNTANEVKLGITQSWVSVTQRGQSHHNHSHPNSVVSGVLYINLAPNDGINFFRNEDLLWYELIPRDQNYYNAYSYFIETRVGDLVLFPSNLKHGVREVTEDVQRVSLAFNTFFSGELGRQDFSNHVRIHLD